jgi:hypothetical protein
MLKVYLNKIEKKISQLLTYKQVRRNYNYPFGVRQNSVLASSSHLSEKINPYYVTGFCDAESTFIVGIFKQGNL